MSKRDLQHRETLVLETMLSGLDARESAKAAASPMLIYLTELLTQRAREELEEVRCALEDLEAGAPDGEVKTGTVEDGGAKA